ncbi:ABC transporter permease [Promicromonospora thailandica]|uniref:Transport permease protein n=1 Tax=Promicromonospora thailandica TaxID=765201 RepID=A0A9X2G3G0_9MICO|nr:ABC transporter permease [Promicromonospora thailandica]MCP2264748.1 ABC-2 type transport system permease protein [Promicromonospora thailandica]
MSTTTETTGTTTRTAPGARRLPGTLWLGLVRGGVELREYVRERDSIIFGFAYPIVMLAIFATVFGDDEPITVDGTTVSFAQYFLPGMVATGIMLSTYQTLAISIAVERDDGSLKRLRATPLPPTSYFLGKVFLSLTTVLVQTALLLAVAALVFDVPLPDEPDRWVTFAWVFVLGTAAGALCGVAYSSVPRSGRSASAVVVTPLLVLQFTSGVFFSVSQLPEWMINLSSLFPLKWVAQGMRSVFLPDEFALAEPAEAWQHGATAAVLAAWLVVALVVGTRTFRWRRHDDG